MKALVILFLIAFPSWATAQSKPSTQEEIISRTREGFRNAKTKEAVEGVTLWCRDSIKAMDFKTRDRLMVEAVKLMEAGKLAEANQRLKTVGDMEEIAASLARLVCNREKY
jgi:hypothetical protein